MPDIGDISCPLFSCFARISYKPCGAIRTENDLQARFSLLSASVSVVYESLYVIEAKRACPVLLVCSFLLLRRRGAVAFAFAFAFALNLKVL